MFRRIISLAAALLALSHPLLAAPVRTFQDGLKRAGAEKPFVVFCYGANFDKYNVDVYNTFIKGRNPALSRVLNNEVFLVLPVYQQPTDHEKREYEKIMGRNRVRGVRSYPSFIVLDGQGNFRASVQSSEELESPEKAAAALTTVLADFRKQQKLLSQAASAKGDTKTRLMREALAIHTVKVPNHKECDPANDGLVERLQSMDKDLTRANAYVRHMIAKGNYTPVERQMILTAYAGLLRRSGGSVEQLRALYTEIRNILPTSAYGYYSEGAMMKWVEPRLKEPARGE